MLFCIILFCIILYFSSNMYLPTNTYTCVHHRLVRETRIIWWWVLYNMMMSSQRYNVVRHLNICSYWIIFKLFSHTFADCCVCWCMVSCGRNFRSFYVYRKWNPATLSPANYLSISQYHCVIDRIQGNIFIQLLIIHICCMYMSYFFVFLSLTHHSQ